MNLNGTSNDLLDRALDYYSWTLTFAGKSPVKSQIRWIDFKSKLNLRYPYARMAFCGLTSSNHSANVVLSGNRLGRTETYAKVSTLFKCFSLIFEQFDELTVEIL